MCGGKKRDKKAIQTLTSLEETNGGKDGHRGRAVCDSAGVNCDKTIMHVVTNYVKQHKTVP